MHSLTIIICHVTNIFPYDMDHVIGLHCGSCSNRIQIVLELFKTLSKFNCVSLIQKKLEIRVIMCGTKIFGCHYGLKSLHRPSFFDKLGVSFLRHRPASLPSGRKTVFYSFKGSPNTFKAGKIISWHFKRVHSNS